MPVGSRFAGWLKDLGATPSARRTKAAEHLLATSEFYFDEKKLDANEREQLLRSLVSFASDDDPVVREACVYIAGLLHLWSDLTERLIRLALRDSEPKVQAMAVFTTGQLGTAAAPLVRDLLGLSSHADERVRFRVAWALPRLGVRTGEVVAALSELAGDTHRTTRMYAVDALPYCLHTSAEFISDVVSTSLDDSAAEVRGAACRAIARIDHDWSRFLDRLWTIFRSDVHGNQSEALVTMCHRWPNLTNRPEISAWLSANPDYWWVEDLLAGRPLHFPATPP